MSRPWTYGPTWDAMTPEERKNVARRDWIIGLLGTIFIYWWLP